MSEIMDATPLLRLANNPKFSPANTSFRNSKGKKTKPSSCECTKQRKRLGFHKHNSTFCIVATWVVLVTIQACLLASARGTTFFSFGSNSSQDTDSEYVDSFEYSKTQSGVVTMPHDPMRKIGSLIGNEVGVEDVDESVVAVIHDELINHGKAVKVTRSPKQILKPELQFLQSQSNNAEATLKLLRTVKTKEIMLTKNVPFVDIKLNIQQKLMNEVEDKERKTAASAKASDLTLSIPDNKKNILGKGHGNLRGPVIRINGRKIPASRMSATMLAENSYQEHLERKQLEVQQKNVYNGVHEVRIFVYDLPEWFNKAQVSKNWPTSGQSVYHKDYGKFAELEPEFQELLNKSNIITQNPNEATHFLIPVYTFAYCGRLKSIGNTGNEVLYEYSICRSFLLSAIRYIRINYPERWQKSNGADHLLFSPFDTDSCVTHSSNQMKQFGGRIKALENVRVIGFLGPQLISSPCTRPHDLLVAPNPSKRFVELADKLTVDLKGAPFTPKYFKTERKTRYFFRGNFETSHFRIRLVNKLKHMSNVVIKQDKTDVSIFLDEMFHSQFCLVPQGHAPWTFRFSEAIYAGCFPIVAVETAQMIKEFPQPCNHLVDYSKFTLFISGENMDLEAQVEAITSNLDGALEALAQARHLVVPSTGMMECLEHQLKSPSN